MIYNLIWKSPALNFSSQLMHFFTLLQHLICFIVKMVKVHNLKAIFIYQAFISIHGLFFEQLGDLNDVKCWSLIIFFHNLHSPIFHHEYCLHTLNKELVSNVVGIGCKISCFCLL